MFLNQIFFPVVKSNNCGAFMDAMSKPPPLA